MSSGSKGRAMCFYCKKTVRRDRLRAHILVIHNDAKYREAAPAGTSSLHKFTKPKERLDQHVVEEPESSVQQSPDTADSECDNSDMEIEHEDSTSSQKDDQSGPTDQSPSQLHVPPPPDIDMLKVKATFSFSKNRLQNGSKTNLRIFNVKHV